MEQPYDNPAARVFKSHNYAYAGTVGESTHLINNQKGSRVASIIGNTVTDRSGGKLEEDNDLIRDLKDAGVVITNDLPKVALTR